MIPHSKPFLNTSDEVGMMNLCSTGMLTAGEINRQFTTELGRTLGFEYVQVTTSGTMAFYKILLTLGIGQGDELLLPDYICNSLLTPISMVGANVMLYDNRENSWQTSVEMIMKKVTPKTRLILINHVFGFAFKEIETLRNILPTDIHIVEDCCHAVTPMREFGNFKSGSGSICCFYSFNATKYLATGEGGAIGTNDSAFQSELRQLNFGDVLSDISCSLGLSQLKKLDFFVERRKEIASRYEEIFYEYIPESTDLNSCAFFRFPILVRDASIFLKQNQVAYRKGVDSLLSDSLSLKNSENAKKMLDMTISIPIYPSLTNGEVQTIIDTTGQLLTK